MAMNTAMYFEMIISITIGLTFIALILLFIYMTYVKEEQSEVPTVSLINKRERMFTLHQKVSRIMLMFA